MRSRSSSPNTPSSDSSPSSSDLPLTAPIEPSIPPELAPKEYDEARLFNAFINDNAFDAASPIVQAPGCATFDRLHSVLSSAQRYHVPLHAHVVRPSASALVPPLADQDVEELEHEPDLKHEGQIVNPPKESCVNLPIRVRNVPLQGAKSRVETQLKVTIDLVWDPTPRAHFHQASSSLSAYSGGSHNSSDATVGSWEWISLPAGSATKRRGRKDAKIAPTPEQTLTLHTMVHVASAPHTAARACKKCLGREAKRAERKRRGPNDLDPVPTVESSTGLEDDKIVLYNCADVLDFKSGTVDLPVRLTCYCRHHSEKVGFCITFILRDHTGRTVGTGVTPPILITDDHKSTARKVQVQAQQSQTQAPAVVVRKGVKDKTVGGKHRMQKPYARSTGTSRASSLGLGGIGALGGAMNVKEEAGCALGFGGTPVYNNGAGAYGNGNGGSSYGTPSTQGYMSPPPQSPTHFAGANTMSPVVFGMMDGMQNAMLADGFQLGDGTMAMPRVVRDQTLLSPTRSAFLSPPRSPVHSRTHTRPQTPAQAQAMLGSPVHTRIHSPVQTRVHSRAHSPIRSGASVGPGMLSPARSPVHSRSHSRNGHVLGLDGMLDHLGGLPADMLMGSLLGDGMMGGSSEGLMGMDNGAFVGGGFAGPDSHMFESSFDPSNPNSAPGTDWEGMLQEFTATQQPKSQPAMYVEHPPNVSGWEPNTSATPVTVPWAPEAMDLSIPDPAPFPRVSRVVPNSGPIQGGIEVTLLGENFTRAYECRFGEYIATETTLWSGNTLVCLLPPAAQPGVVPVSIKGYEHIRMPGEREVMFTYKDDLVDRNLLEMALRVVGQRMTGRQEEPSNIARRIVAVEEMQTNSNGLMTRLAQSVIESADPGEHQEASSSREKEIIQFLTLLDVPHVGSRTVSTSAAVSLQNETGHTLLHLCAVLGFDALATDLLERGADPDVRDATGQTALHLAALRGEAACVRVLLDGGADAEIVNACGMVPADIARERGCVEILSLLEGLDEGEEAQTGPEDEEAAEDDLEVYGTDDSAGVEADESDLEDMAGEREEDIVSSCSEEASESDMFAEDPSRSSLDPIVDGRPPFFGDVHKIPSTWFHRTFSHLQPQKAWPLTQINLPDIPALPAWPVTIPWPQTPDKGTFDLAAFRGFLGTKQVQTDAGMQMTYPPPQPESGSQGLNQVQLRTRLARRLGYYPTEVTEREVRAYTHHSQKMRKLKKDRMLVLFWLPILLIVIAWGLYQSVPMALHVMMHTVKGLLPLANQ